MRSYPRADRDARPDETLTFYVRAEECGVRDNPEACLLAQCAMRAFDTDEVWFGRTTAYIEIGRELVRFGYDHRTRDAVRRYDETGEMEPGVYKVIPPEPSKRLGVRKNTNTGTGEPRPNAGKRSVWSPPRGWGKQSTLHRLPDGID